nr:hypothetical protein [Pseudomonas aeruginosa]
MAKLLLNYRKVYGLRTVESLIARWAPSNENNTRAYASAVARAMRRQASTWTRPPWSLW